MGGLFRKSLLFFLSIFLVVGGILVYSKGGGRGEEPQYRLAKVQRGSIVSSVSCTGALSAVVTVKVGSQVSGQIMELPADFNSQVSKDQVIARIDPENFKAKVLQSEAELAVSRANVSIKRAAIERARAELVNSREALGAAKAQTEKARIALADAKRDLNRKKKLHKNKIISESEIDRTRAVHDQALAQLEAAKADERARISFVSARVAALKMAEAEVVYAKAQVKQRGAALQSSKVSLNHTIIRSPVDGVVIERNVDIGQTVAASLQAPTLFTIAQDLREMQVETDIDEADIGQIQEGQRATFTVDAFPGKEFVGSIQQIRKAPKTLQNVVTYTVVISAENSDLHLLPGMTANVKVVVGERTQALRIPNAALRFRPAGQGETSKGAGGAPVATGPAKGGPRSGEDLIKRLDKGLSLSGDQKEQMRALFAEVRKKIMAMRRGGARRDEIGPEVKRLREQNRIKIMRILTPEQREKFKKLRSARIANPLTPGRVWVLGAGGKPEPVDVVAGMSDGSFTEIVRGDLEPGQQVILGTVQPSGRRKSSGRRFGF
ncbi:MAG: efflux RND transporter periplasmic adaptor subunit [Deltaproteobacteria bacterium]|nr:efflux RND transporter periplasmic adaptor subunit [Deltaproteobacteria bacterium]